MGAIIPAADERGNTQPYMYFQTAFIRGWNE